ncbi:DNA/RNA non-specific endonuclease [Fibrisoma limi]|uniref:DNA/RNA non-specific endonuclease n=1 Tax=Fibrisoma limi TaxID=663275 RepID=UPI0009FDA859|nr:DNA/RNA non-specific endonuclease [Fibrisoma limi]
MLEEYCRKLVSEGNELYIIAGTWGKGGEGDNGSAQTIVGSKLTVPAALWKMIVVLPVIWHI